MEIERLLPGEQITDFCRRWKVQELALFGSVLRDDFRPDRDVDLLATVSPDAEWSFLDHMQMEEELSSFIGRDVDLVSRRTLERSDNWIRRQAILDGAKVVYHK